VLEAQSLLMRFLKTTMEELLDGIEATTHAEDQPEPAAALGMADGV